MSKHTPGPWHWEADEVKGDPTGRVRYQVTATGKTITRIYYSSYEGGITNAEADARLIAAAPELLDAAIELKDVCNRPSAARTRAEAWRKLDKAIAKALQPNPKVSGADRRPLD